jgi:hypothetical protein
MGKEARANAARRARERPNLLSRLREHVSFLDASAAAFDNGFEAEAKRLAVSLRVLLHHTAASQALLNQLGVTDRLRFTDTSEPISPYTLGPSLGLVLLRLDGRTGAGTYIAPLGGLPPPRIKPPTEFVRWWNVDLYIDEERTAWNRKQFVQTLANKEGGAHVDPKLNDAYERLVTSNGLGFSARTADGMQPFAGSPVAASVRQITYEVLTTLERQADLFT